MSRKHSVRLSPGARSLLSQLADELGVGDEDAVRYSLAVVAVVMRDPVLMMTVSRALADRIGELSGDPRHKAS